MWEKAKVLLGEVGENRYLFFCLLAQDLKIRYRRLLLSYSWSFLHPLLLLTLLSFIFSHFVHLEVKNYAHYLFSGLLAYTFFSSALMAASRSFLEYEPLMKRIRTPKLFFPLTKVSTKLIDFLTSLLTLLFLGWVLEYPCHKTLWIVPLAIVPLFLFTCGLGILVALLNAYYRDTEYLLGVFLQWLYFATPVLYPIHLIPDPYHKLLELNPMFWFIELFHCVIYEGTWPTLEQWSLAWMGAVVSFIFGFVALAFYEEKLIYQL